MKNGRPHIVAMSPTWFDGTSLIGGTDGYPGNVARAVAAAGGGRVAVTLVTFGPMAAEEDLAPDARHVVLPVPASNLPRLVDTISWGMEEAVRGASLVHVHQAFTRFGQAAVLAAGLHDLPMVLSDHRGPTLSGRAQAELRRVADGVIAFSAFDRQVSGGAAAIIMGGVDTDWFFPSAGSPTPNGFAYVGSILPHNRIERAIEALPDGARLVVCGRTSDETYLKELHRLAGGRDVAFVHDADDVALREIYRSTQALILLSEHVDQSGNFARAPELMGLSVLEAMACGTPAVVAPTGALPEYVIDQHTGFVVHDDDQLAEVLADIHAHPERAAQHGATARAHLQGRWDLSSVGQHYLDVYRQTIEAYNIERDR